MTHMNDAPFYAYSCPSQLTVIGIHNVIKDAYAIHTVGQHVTHRFYAA